jgi:hypothetical protein
MAISGTLPPNTRMHSQKQVTTMVDANIAATAGSTRRRATATTTMVATPAAPGSCEFKIVLQTANAIGLTTKPRLRRVEKATVERYELRT